MSLVHFTLRYGEVSRSIRITEEVLEDPQDVLRAFGKVWLKQTKEWMAREGDGAWPPWAVSTRKKYEYTGTSQITKQGTVRKDRVARLAKAMKRTEAAIKKEGATPKLRARLAKLRLQVDRIAKAERRVQRKDFKKRTTGRSIIGKKKLLGRLPGSVRFRVLKGGILRAYSKAGRLADVHNSGEGQNPQREFVRVTEDQLDVLAEMLEADVVEAWDGEKG